MTRNVLLSFYQHRETQAPLAVVRYTLYDVDEKVVDIQQFTYPDTRKGWEDFEEQVVTALESDIDTSILSTQSVKDFPKLDGYLQSIGYYLTRDT